ncbi:hypothetical protein ACWDO7_20610 [Streptomyces sp. NPDC003656]|uniref:hypothetical protein n=1 Tax=Streptomyces sp. DSM 110735 TaxID=2775031 RepID=UPI0018F577C8|nr:hypothetical protein [Streptomyces sp. DSM 110735]MBJ7904831.1 hypothetical protein [Streptomyces sp. DSM 110735]
MNVRLLMQFVVVMAITLGLFFGGLAEGGMMLGLLGMVFAFFVLVPLVQALFPPSFFPAPRGAQATCALYRGWGAKLAIRLGRGPSRTVRADAERLRRGVRLSMLAYGMRDGSQTLGYLLLDQSADGAVRVAWRKRGKGAVDQPVQLRSAVVVRPEREQQNGVQARMGYTAAVDLGEASYWLRPHDAALLQLVLANSAPVAPHLPR